MQIVEITKTTYRLASKCMNLLVLSCKGRCSVGAFYYLIWLRRRCFVNSPFDFLQIREILGIKDLETVGS